MGLPPFLISATLNTSVAQRLVRLLCPHCKLETTFTEAIFPPQYSPLFRIESYFTPIGCDKCFGTGYKGRKAIYEVLPIDNTLAKLIKSNSYDIQDYLSEKNISTISTNAFQLFAKGQTSIDEIYPLLLQN
jgi:general secretion pathway protein E/type IV pilus assembly protein PilB